MDPNGQRFWMLHERQHWQIASAPPPLRYDVARGSLQLASQRPSAGLGVMVTPALVAEAESRLARCPQTRDAWDTRAWWDGPSGQVMAGGALPGTVPIFVPASGALVSDLALGYDGVLYMVIDHEIVLLDRRDRWPPTRIAEPDFSAWRIAAAPGGGVWALDPTGRRVGRVRGLPRVGQPGSDGTSFRQCADDVDPPRLEVVAREICGAEQRPVAIACSPDGQLAVLFWASDGAQLRLLDGDHFGMARPLPGAALPYSLVWLGEDRVAVLLAGLPREAPVYELGPAEQPLALVGEIYPLRDYAGGPFVHGVSLPPHYPTTVSERTAKTTAPLLPVSLPAFAPLGEAAGVPLDSGSADTVWHRLYVEAALPPTAGLTLLLAANDAPAPPPVDGAWHRHLVGEGWPGDGWTPRAAWVPAASEIAFHDGLLQCRPERNRAGLWTVLIQRDNHPVRTLRGRFLHVRLILHGNGRSSPEVAAVRAYGSRFSYLNSYLPELYRETLFGADADAPLPDGPPRSTPADFLERLLDNFEGLLTPLEDRIRSADLLTDPRTAPAEALPWLGSWIGVAADGAYPAERQRALIAAAPQLWQTRGTARGLALALDIATGGGVRGGEIIILEDWRLRRTFATILGADLADERDPLLAGLAASGNSYVGDTLVLGDEGRKEFLALYSADLPVTAVEADAIAALFDRLAQRVTVLVHQEVEPQDLGLIRRIVDLEVPAHVLARVLTASDALMVGISALVGVDTYLGIEPPPAPVRVGRSSVGVRDRIMTLPALDPRLDGGSYAATAPSPRPTADAGAAQTAEYGSSFTLDGSGSRAAPGRSIARYRWTLEE